MVRALLIDKQKMFSLSSKKMSGIASRHCEQYSGIGKDRDRGREKSHISHRSSRSFAKKRSTHCVRLCFRSGADHAAYREFALPESAVRQGLAYQTAGTRKNV